MIKYFSPIKLLSYDHETGRAEIENVDGSPFPCGLLRINRSVTSFIEDKPGEIQAAITKLVNKQVGG